MNVKIEFLKLKDKNSLNKKRKNRLNLFFTATTSELFIEFV